MSPERDAPRAVGVSVPRTDGFDKVTAACPVPIVMAGGTKLPEIEALTLAYNAAQEGASGVDMGRNIFQSQAPQAMIQAVGKVVHEDYSPERGLELYRDLAADASAGA